MATTEQASFMLDRFEPTAPGEIQVAGVWARVDRRHLTDPALIVHTDQGAHRLEALRSEVRGIRRWRAVFAWEGDAAAILRAELEVGRNLVVALPAPNANKRELRRSPLIRGVEPDGRAHREAEIAPDADAMALHAALVAARDEAAEAAEEVKEAREEARRAREDAQRERSRRQNEGTRLHEAVATLRRVAEDSLQQERATTQQLSGELDAAEASLERERAEAAELREQMDAAVRARVEARAQARLQVERLSAELASARRELEERESLDTGEVARLNVLLGEAQAEQVRASKAAEAEVARLGTALLEAQRTGDRSNGEIERLRAALHQAKKEVERSGGEVEHLRAALVQVKKLSTQRNADLEALHLEMGQFHERLAQAAGGSSA